jgi:hypothetical protein
MKHAARITSERQPTRKSSSDEMPRWAVRDLRGRSRPGRVSGSSRAQLTIYCRSGLFHVSARLQPALEAAEIAYVGITHFLEGLADER